MPVSFVERVAARFFDHGGAVFNARHPDFGAAGDGTTDDTAALQAAIDAAEAVGGECLVPAGTYRVTDRLIIDSDNTTLRMARGTTLVMDDGSWTPFEWDANAVFPTKKAVIVVSGATGVHVIGGTIDCDDLEHETGTDGCGILVYGSDQVVVQGVSVLNVHPEPIGQDEWGGWQDGSGTDLSIRYDGLEAIKSSEVTFRDCYAENIRYSGFRAHVGCRNISFVDSQATLCFEGFQATIQYGQTPASEIDEADRFCENVLIHGNRVWEDRGDGAAIVSHANNTIVSHNVVRNFGHYAFAWRQTHAGTPGCVFVGNTAKAPREGATSFFNINEHNSVIADNFCDGEGVELVVGVVEMTGGDNHLIKGNHFRRIHGTPGAIEVKGTARFVDIIGNYLEATGANATDCITVTNTGAITVKVVGNTVVATSFTINGFRHNVADSQPTVLIITGNSFLVTGFGIITASQNAVIANNRVRRSGSAGNVGIETDRNSVGSGLSVLVQGNSVEGFTTQISNQGGSSGVRIRDNLGFVTSNNGVATLASGTTSIAVTHGLASTPALKDISVTPIEAWGAMTQFWASDPTSTQFTINADQNPTQDVDFSWVASIR